MSHRVWVLAGDLGKADGEYLEIKDSGIGERCILFRKHDPSNPGKLLPGWSEKIPLSHFKKVDKASEATVSTYGGALGWGAAGALVLGPVGLLAGLFLGGGNVSEVTFVTELKDGRKLIARAEEWIYSQILAAVFRSDSEPVTGNRVEQIKGVSKPVPHNIHTTCLLWAKNGNIAEKAMNWNDAMRWANNLNYEGYSDWRLPTIEELKTLVTRGGNNPPIFYNTAGFRSVQPGHYWSSSNYPNNTNDAWVVNMVGCGERNASKTFKFYVWPVRSETEHT